VIPPRARDLVDERLGAVAVLEHQRNRHVAARENDQQHGEGDQRQHALDDRNRPHGAPHLGSCAEREDHQDELQRR
jgi:hypothetical protein